MSPLYSATKCFVQKVFFPEALVSRNLSASWSGIFLRVTRLPKKTIPLKLGERNIQLLSRDEYERCADYNFEKLLSQHPRDSFKQIIITPDKTKKDL